MNLSWHGRTGYSWLSGLGPVGGPILIWLLHNHVLLSVGGRHTIVAGMHLHRLCPIVGLPIIGLHLNEMCAIGGLHFNRLRTVTRLHLNGLCNILYLLACCRTRIGTPHSCCNNRLRIDWSRWSARSSR